jgi:hypothetical protein
MGGQGPCRHETAYLGSGSRLREQFFCTISAPHHTLFGGRRLHVRTLLHTLLHLGHGRDSVSHHNHEALDRLRDEGARADLASQPLPPGRIGGRVLGEPRPRVEGVLRDVDELGELPHRQPRVGGEMLARLLIPVDDGLLKAILGLATAPVFALQRPRCVPYLRRCMCRCLRPRLRLRLLLRLLMLPLALLALRWSRNWPKVVSYTVIMKRFLKFTYGNQQSQ